MRLVATEYLSLDGVFEEPGTWSFPFFDEQASQFKWRELQESDALLLGRKTSEGFAAAWPTMEGTGEFGLEMNSMPKYVISSTLADAAWEGSVVLSGPLEAEIDELSALGPVGTCCSPAADSCSTRSGGPTASISIASWCIPSCSGRGARLFAVDADQTVLTLTHHEVFGSGIAVLEYEPVERS